MVCDGGDVGVWGDVGECEGVMGWGERGRVFLEGVWSL